MLLFQYDPQEGTSSGRKRGRPPLSEEAKAVKGIKKHAKEAFQYECKKCKRRYATLRIMRAHEHICDYCDVCKSWADKRHLLRCKQAEEEGNVKARKGTRIMCHLCRRLRSKAGMYRHMKDYHEIPGWKRREHPEDLSEVKIIIY